MKAILIGLAALCAGIQTYAQYHVKVPHIVTKAFANKYPDATGMKWTKEMQIMKFRSPISRGR